MTTPKRPLTLDEYLEIEASSDVRHEFLNGEMFAARDQRHSADGTSCKTGGSGSGGVQ